VAAAKWGGLSMVVVIGLSSAAWLMLVVTVASLCAAARAGDMQLLSYLHEAADLELVAAGGSPATANRR
jgi:hypothetical protein